MAQNSIIVNSKRESAIFTAKQCEIFGNEIIPMYSENIIELYEKYNIEPFIIKDENKTIFDIEYKSWFEKYLNEILKDGSEVYEKTMTFLNHLEAFCSPYM